MSISNELWFANPGADAYEIDYSCRFNDDDTAYLSRTFGSGGDRKKWTFSIWFKLCEVPGAVSSEHLIFHQSNTHFYITADGEFNAYEYSGGVIWSLRTVQRLRDPSAWYHWVIVYDSGNATASERLKFYLNGELLTGPWQTNVPPALNRESNINSNAAHYLAIDASSSPGRTDAYFSAINFINEQALDATSFGEFNSDTGQWVPIEYAGAYGGTSCHLDFADSSALGNDVSGNNNDWTSSGLATNDQVTDTPTNNWCTLNYLNDMGSSKDYQDGNLKLVFTPTGAWSGTFATFRVPQTLKWKWEQVPLQLNYSVMALALPSSNLISSGYNDAKNYCYTNDGGIRYGGVTQVSTTAWTVNDVVEVRVDNGTVDFYLNNVLKHSFTQPMSDADEEYYPALWLNGNGSSGQVLDFGQHGFAYTPTDFLALNTTNLPDPAIPDPSAHFQATLYTGNATAGRAITQDGNSTFGPDMVWIKNRDQADEWKALDTTRGATKEVNLDSTNIESTDANGLTAFSGSDGFTLGTGAGGYNDNGEDFVAYQWEKGVTPGFDIVSFTAPSGTTAFSTAHNLGVTPNLFIQKAVNASNSWIVWADKLFCIL